MELAKARDHLTAVLDAPPAVAELAAYLELAEDEVIARTPNGRSDGPGHEPRRRLPCLGTLAERVRRP